MPSIKKMLKDANSTHLACRDFAHAWEWDNTFEPIMEGRKMFGVTRIVTCLRCGSKRYDEYSLPSMTRIRSYYSYADGYRLLGYKGHVPVADVRREILTRSDIVK